MAVNFETVNRIAREYAIDVSRELPVDKAILFGSYAKGYAGEQSDIDICFFLKDYNGKRRVDLLTQILGVGGKKYHGTFFEPIVFVFNGINRQFFFKTHKNLFYIMCFRGVIIKINSIQTFAQFF